MKLRFHFFVGLLAMVGLFAQLSMLHAQAPVTNRVLELDGMNSYLELPPNIFNNLDEATIEAWVKWERLGGPGWNRVFNYGSAGHDLSIGTKDSDTLWFVFVDANHGFQEVAVHGVLKLNEWIHVAAVSGKGGMRVYVNGRLAGQNPNPGSFSALKTGELNRLGKSVTENDADPPFQGQLDEVRIWKMARTEEEIRQGMSRMLTGGEPGLAGLWNFDDPANPGRDASPAGHHGKLMGKARLLPASYPGPVGIPSAEPEKVLTLAGNGNYLELPAELFQGLNVATLECRVKWHSFAGNEHVFEFDAAKRVKVGNRLGQSDLEFVAAAPPATTPPNARPLRPARKRATQLLKQGCWLSTAGIISRSSLTHAGRSFTWTGHWSEQRHTLTASLPRGMRRGISWVPARCIPITVFMANCVKFGCGGSRARRSKFARISSGR